jgi:PHD/YefM family antitoxin component YafN of YafNO toxin-antitoxin module
LFYGEAMKEPTQFLVNEKGEKVAVVIGIQEYEKLLEQLDELEDIRAFDEAEASGETPIPFDQAVAQIERSRK